MARTKSGLTIHTIELEHKGVLQTLAQEHSWLVRFTHWLNAISLVVMTMSGLQIYTALSNFYSMLTGWKSDPDYLAVHSSGRG